MLYEVIFDFFVLGVALFFLTRRVGERAFLVVFTAALVAFLNLALSITLRGVVGLFALLGILAIDGAVLRLILIRDTWRSIGAATILACAKFVYVIIRLSTG